MPPNKDEEDSEEEEMAINWLWQARQSETDIGLRLQNLPQSQSLASHKDPSISLTAEDTNSSTFYSIRETGSCTRTT